MPCRSFAVLLVASFFALAPAVAAGQEQPTAGAQHVAPTQPARIEGFRSAQWGMTEAQVKTGIAKDFKLAAEKIKSEENLAERTQVLAIAVPDLLEGAGAAKISYIFGYASKKLIQVNVLWGTASDPQVSTERILAAADQLRQLFLDSGYEPASIVANARTGDGEVLVFKGEDADKHVTVLRLAAATQPVRSGSSEKPATATALVLSYIFDAQNPDVYRLKKGQF